MEDSASHRLTEATNQLCSNKAESLQRVRAQETKSKAVPEETREELVEIKQLTGF